MFEYLRTPHVTLGLANLHWAVPHFKVSLEVRHFKATLEMRHFKAAHEGRHFKAALEVQHLKATLVGGMQGLLL